MNERKNSKTKRHTNKNEFADKNINQQENETKYGETIPSMFSWITPSEQKQRAEQLNDMTKDKTEQE